MLNHVTRNLGTNITANEHFTMLYKHARNSTENRRVEHQHLPWEENFNLAVYNEFMILLNPRQLLIKVNGAKNKNKVLKRIFICSLPKITCDILMRICNCKATFKPYPVLSIKYPHIVFTLMPAHTLWTYSFRPLPWKV